MIWLGSGTHSSTVEPNRSKYTTKSKASFDQVGAQGLLIGYVLSRAFVLHCYQSQAAR
jgi:hypothetical protein